MQTGRNLASRQVLFYHNQSSSRHKTHKALTVSLQPQRSSAAFQISLQVKRMVLSSFSVDLLQVVLGLPVVFSLLVSRIELL